MLIYPHAVIVRKTANESINISAMNLISSNDRADNPMTNWKMNIVWKMRKYRISADGICSYIQMISEDKYKGETL